MASVALVAHVCGGAGIPVPGRLVGAKSQCGAPSFRLHTRSQGPSSLHSSNAPGCSCLRVSLQHSRCPFLDSSLGSRQSIFNGGQLRVRRVPTSRSKRCMVMANDRLEGAGDPPLLRGKMAEFVSRTRRPGATSGNSEVENAYRLREAIKQTRERILAQRQQNVRQAATAGSTYSSTSTTDAKSSRATSQSSKSVADSIPKPESPTGRPAPKKQDPWEDPKPESSTAKAEPVKSETKRSSKKAEPARAKVKATAAGGTRASRARAASKAAEPEAPRLFVSGPDGVAVLSEASDKGATSGAGKKASVKADGRKGVKRKTKAPAVIAVKEEGESLNGEKTRVESGTGELNGAAKVGENGRGIADAPVLAGEPTLATSALKMSVGASYAQGPTTVVTAELESGGGLGAGPASSTTVLERTLGEEVKAVEGTAKAGAAAVNGAESSRTEAGLSESATTSSGHGGVSDYSVNEQSSSAEGRGTQAGGESEPAVRSGKAAEKGEKAKESPSTVKNKYASKKSEPRKDIKDKLASFRGGSLVDRLLAAPKLQPILAAANLDTQGMVRLIRDLSTKEGAAKKPGATAKTFSWLRKNKAPLDPVVYVAALESFAREGNHSAAQEVIDDMKEHKVNRTPEHILNLLTAYRVARRYREATDVVMTSLGQSDVTLDTTSFNGALRACAEGGLGAEKLLEVYSAMQSASLVETNETYAYVIEQCLLAKKDMPATGWVAEQMREKGFNLDKVGARVVERLLDEGRVEEAWERFINWKPAKGRWSATLYSKMLEGLISKDLAQDVSLHVSEMQRYKILIPPELWEKVTKIANGFGLQPPTLESASAQAASAPAAGTDSDTNRSSRAANPPREVQTVTAKDIRLKGPLAALSESLVKRTAFPSTDRNEKSDKTVAREDKAPTMKQVWTPRGTFFTAPRVPRPEGAASSFAVGGQTSTVSQGGSSEQGVPSASVSQERAAQGGPPGSASRGDVSERKGQGAASKADISAELEPYWKLIRVQISKGRISGAAETLEDVLQLGLVPTADMYKELIVACSKSGLKDTAWSLIRQMQESGHIPTPDLFEALR